MKKTKVKKINDKGSHKVLKKPAGKSSGGSSTTRGADYVKWALVALILAAAMIGNVYYEHFSPSLRLIIGIVVGIVMLLVAWQTSHGQKAWKFFKEARNEIRRVIWPSRQQTTQITLVVAAMVAVAAVATFVLDQIFMLLIRLVTG